MEVSLTRLLLALSCTALSPQSCPKSHSCAVSELALSLGSQTHGSGRRGGEFAVPLGALKALTETWEKKVKMYFFFITIIILLSFNGKSNRA